MPKLLEELWRDYSEESQPEFSLKMEDEQSEIEEGWISKIINWILSFLD
jgi:hypothetical protein